MIQSMERPLNHAMCLTGSFFLLTMSIGGAGCSDSAQPVETLTAYESSEQLLARMLLDYKEEMSCVTPVHIVSPATCSFAPSGPVVSEADSDSIHSQKLYHLFATDPQAYHATIDDITEAPIGLILLKETHEAIELDGRASRVPEELESPEFFWQRASSIRSSVPNLVPGQITEYFFMAKVSQESALATDNGWLYGEMDLDGNITTLTSTGRCFECHSRSPYDRVFGIPKPKIMYTGRPYSDDELLLREQKLDEEFDKELNQP